MKPKNLIIDCDDTLWENNRYFLEAHQKFLSLMQGRGHDRQKVDMLLLKLEMDNVPKYGYGAKSQARSMADVYMLFEPDPDPETLMMINAIGEAVFNHPVTLLPGVKETLPKLYGRYRLFLYTKGNHDEQLGKIKKSPMAKFFEQYRIVPEKNQVSFREMLDSFGLAPSETWMVGDSPKSDILPAVANGVRSVYIPFELTWAVERQELPESEHIITVETFDHLERLLL
ncbi:MAG TPA: HAD hydrolase-like protein [Nitrospirota bacterium]|jgi:putative hydrolase of the HAD superfamily